MRGLLLLLAFLLLPGGAHAMSIDVSDETISVTTGFTGTALTVFGMQEQPGAVVIVVEGPPKTLTVRKKSRVLGLWTNTERRTFKNVPSFYEVASTGPLDLIAPAEVLRQRRIGVENLGLEARRRVEGSAEFLEALIHSQEEKNLFVPDVLPLAYPGPLLFKARFSMPALVPQGEYKVSAYLFQNGQVVDEDSTAIVVMPEGLSADMRRFAREDGFLYGLCGMLMAVFAGWLATVLLKRE